MMGTDADTEDPRSTFRFDLPLVLPEVGDAQDQCVTRLVSLLESKDGVSRVHVVRGGHPFPDDVLETEKRKQAPDAAPLSTDPQLCLHYDPERVSLAQLTSLVHAAGAEVRQTYGHALFDFRAIGSEDDGRRIEDELRSLHGVTAASVSFAAQVARVEFELREITREEIASHMRRLGLVLTDVYAERPITPPGKTAAVPSVAEVAPWHRRHIELVWSGAAGLFLIVARFAAPGGSAVQIALYLFSYFFGSRDNVGHFIKDLRRGRFHFNIDLLMVVAAAGAAALGQWFEGALLLFLFSLGHALEHYALGRARHAISALADLVPQTAIVLRGGAETETPINAVSKGDTVVVKPGSRIPVDGIVSQGSSTANQAPITGESMPVSKNTGDQVFAGSVNGESVLLVSVTVAIGDRTLDRVIKLVSEAQTQKAPTQQFTDRFERIFVPVVLIGSALVMILPPLIGLLPWSASIMRGLTVLVAASPCALALGTPAAVLAGIAQAARNGVLIKGGAHLENLGGIDIVALDKTGTLTKGEPEVTDLVTYGDSTEAELLGIAASVEKRSQHPLASAIVRAAAARNISLFEVGEVESLTGLGIRSTIDGDEIFVGRVGMFSDGARTGGATEVPSEITLAVKALEEGGRSTAVVRRAEGTSGSGGFLGVIGIADDHRSSAKESVAQLRRLGIKRIVMLTGDNAGVGNAVGRAVGVDEVKAGLLPEDKVTAIKELARHGKVAMVGDGVNDAPALAHATVGIAMGGAGTAAALETADAALMGDDLSRLGFAIGISRASRRVIRQNLYISLGVIGVLVVTSLFGAVGMSSAIVFHEGSTLVVIANALRLLAFK